MVVKGSPLTVAGTAAASGRAPTAFPFDPRREPSPISLALRFIRVKPNEVAAWAEDPVGSHRGRSDGDGGLGARSAREDEEEIIDSKFMSIMTSALKHEQYIEYFFILNQKTRRSIP